MIRMSFSKMVQAVLVVGLPVTAVVGLLAHRPRYTVLENRDRKEITVILREPGYKVRLRFFANEKGTE